MIGCLVPIKLLTVQPLRDSGRLTEEVARGCYRQLVVGLDYCHKKKVSIRDVKLDNTLVTMMADRMILKISDFGCSINEEKSKAKSFVGTLTYMGINLLHPFNSCL
jgi:serine/threonine protein kinase